MAFEGRVHLGTSGWNYDHWEGPFYPEGLPRDEWLNFYTDHFQSVELNNSFYQLPSVESIERWCDTVPGDFLFSVKANRYLTHMKKLKDPEEGLETFLTRIRHFGDHLGPILFQLPPNWYRDLDRLANFLGLLPLDLRYSFEFRDPDWLTEETFELFEEKGAAHCIYDYDHRLAPRRITADFTYIRLHGPGDPYVDPYDTETLSGWAGAIHQWRSEGIDVYCYFDNDNRGYAVQNAHELKEMISNHDGD